MKFPTLNPIAIGYFVILLTAGLAFAQDDWHVVERHSKSTPPATAPQEEIRTPPNAKVGNGASIQACGEAARPPSDKYRTIVEQLNSMWSSNFKVYESVAEVSPHATTGGCVFYNEAFLTKLLGQWMNMNDERATDPMLYAIFAHEMGHQMHGDTTPATKGVPQKDKELAADHVAGYSIERLGMRRLDPDEVTRYYQLTGDDYTGGGGDHGNGSERAQAFYDGWRRAEMGLPENGGRPAGGFGAP